MTVRATLRLLALTLCTGAWAACDDVTTVQTPPDDPFAGGDPVLGRAAFQQDCASCHASRDGFDLAHFQFPDTTIRRRALAHVDEPTATNIVAHVRTLSARRPSSDEVPLFQPGNRTLGDDVAFAQNLFGVDAWPDTLTREALRAIDPLDVPVALHFPRWSVEENNLDWMPELGLADALLDWNDAAARQRLEEYYRTQGMQDLVNAVQAMRLAERDSANAAAPCARKPIARLNADACFESRRWAATLGAQFMMRLGIETPVHSVIHDSWWDVGFAVRDIVLRDGHFEHGEENWVTWMWMGWMFDPERHASIYMSQGLDRMGLDRHAVFHSLRASVSRGENSIHNYMDAKTTALYAPDSWAFAATKMAYEEVELRLSLGERVPEVYEALARAEIERTYTYASNKVSKDEAATLLEMRDRILAVLDA